MKKLAILSSIVMAIFFAVGRANTLCSQEPMVPFVNSLRDTNISVDRLDSIIDYALIIGNGDINALVFAKDGQLRMMLTKNDVWDARFNLAWVIRQPY